jgi:hypothetical protein
MGAAIPEKTDFAEMNLRTSALYRLDIPTNRFSRVYRR